MIYPIPRKKMLIPKKSPFTKIPGIKKSPDFKNPHSRNKKFWGFLNEDFLGSQIPNPYPRNENSTVPRVQTYTNKDLLSRGILVTGLSNRFLSRSRLCRGFKSLANPCGTRIGIPTLSRDNRPSLKNSIGSINSVFEVFVQNTKL